MHVLEKRGERFFALLTAGSLTQGVMSLLGEWLDTGDPEKDLWAIGSMFAAARAVGTAMREMHKIDGGYLQQHDVDFSASFILAGQLKTGQLRLFLIYDAGNFIDAMDDTIYFQIGEVKYGKPILDRIIQPRTSLKRRGEMRADLLRFRPCAPTCRWGRRSISSSTGAIRCRQVSPTGLRGPIPIFGRYATRGDPHCTRRSRRPSRVRAGSSDPWRASKCGETTTGVAREECYAYEKTSRHGACRHGHDRVGAAGERRIVGLYTRINFAPPGPQYLS